MKETTIAFAAVLAGTTWFATQTIAQNDAFTSELSTQEKMVYRRAVETAVWAMPLTNALSIRDGFA